jgi:chromosome partitioning protein
MMRLAINKIQDDYDFIIIDCSPSLGLITFNVITASNALIIAVQCEYFALEGLGKLLHTIKIVQSRFNEELDIEGILLTMYDARLRLAKQVVEEVQEHFKDLVFDTLIYRNTKLGESPSYGKTILEYDAASPGSLNYLNLAREILQNNDLTNIKNADKTLPEYE